jgi:hypothetical protein
MAAETALMISDSPSRLSAQLGRAVTTLLWSGHLKGFFGEKPFCGRRSVRIETISRLSLGEITMPKGIPTLALTASRTE